MPSKWFKDFIFTYKKKDYVIFIVYTDAEAISMELTHNAQWRTTPAKSHLFHPRAAPSFTGGKSPRNHAVRLRVKEQRFITIEENVTSDLM